MRGDQPGTLRPVLGLEAASSPDERLLQEEQEGQPLPRRQGRRAQLAAQEAAAQATAADVQTLATTRLPNRVPTSARRIEQRLSITARQVFPAGARAPHLMLPGAARKRSYAGRVGFALCVLLPVLIASIYYGFFASNQYMAEFRFSVQDTSTAATMVPSGLQSILGTSSGSSSNNNYLIADFLTSREAVDELQKRINLVNLYSKPGVDWWSRFNSSKPIEKFIPYWQTMAAANYDQVTGLATATVRAFSAEDALLIANNMVKLSEELVNQIANRSQKDAVRFAEKEVERAQERLKEKRAKLTEYRNRVGVIDPTVSVAASNSALVQSQRAALAALETQLATYLNQNLSASAPAVITLKNQIKSTKEQLAQTEADVGRGINGAPLSKVVGEYEQLNLEVQFAQTMVTSSMQALDQARANAASQHLYITPYVRPTLPQSSTYPNRILSILSVFGLSFAFWIICLMVIRSIRERFA